MENSESFEIKEVLFALESRKIYLISKWNEKEKTKVVKFDVLNDDKVETFTVNLDAHSFQIDFLNENKLYFIQKNVIYFQEFIQEKEESGFGNVFKKSLNFFSSKNETENEDELGGAQEFFTSKADIKFLKFEKDMQHFYCDDLNCFKRFQSSNKEVVNVYDEVDFNPTGLILSGDESLIYR